MLIDIPQSGLKNFSHLQFSNSNASEMKEKESQLLLVFKVYVDTAVYCSYILIGLVLNGSLIFLFIRHKEVRNTSNTMILNLAVCDILNLSISGPLHLFWFYNSQNPLQMTNCRCYLAIRQFFRAADAFSLLALNIQRYCITVPSFQRYNSSPLLLCVAIVSIYALALTMALPTVLVWGIYSNLCSTNPDRFQNNLMLLVHFIIYCLILAPMMFVFCFLTARRLKESVKEVPGEIKSTIQDQVRNRSARIIMILSVLFVICYLPYELWNVIVFWTYVDKKNDTAGVSLVVVKYFLFADASFNPIALFIVSGKFRNLLRRYWCSCGHQEDSVTISVSRTTSSFYISS